METKGSLDIAIEQGDGPHVRLTMPRLREATLSGSGTLDVSDFEQDEPMRLVLSGSGEVAFLR